MAMSFFKDVFKFSNAITALKGMLLSLTFAIIWFVWSLLIAALATKAATLALIVMLVFIVFAIFLWGYLAKKFWGWK